MNKNPGAARRPRPGLFAGLENFRPARSSGDKQAEIFRFAGNQPAGFPAKAPASGVGKMAAAISAAARRPRKSEKPPVSGRRGGEGRECFPAGGGTAGTHATALRRSSVETLLPRPPGPLFHLPQQAAPTARGKQPRVLFRAAEPSIRPRRPQSRPPRRDRTKAVRFRQKAPLAFCRRMRYDDVGSFPISHPLGRWRLRSPAAPFYPLSGRAHACSSAVQSSKERM